LFFRDRGRGALAALALMSMTGPGCGYSAVSTPPVGEVRTVAVPLFDNRTFEPLLEARLTERVKARLVSTGPWRLVNRPGAADLVIVGTVTGFGVTPVSFDETHSALEQRVTITVEVTAERRGREAGAPAFRRTLTGTAEYAELGDTLRTRAAKNRAIEEAGDLLAQDLLARLIDAERRPPPPAPESVGEADRPADSATPPPVSAP
jgi:hypothetical protein